MLKFEWTGETEASGNKVLYLVTEPVKPLSAVIEELGLEDEQRTMFIALALRQSAQAVAFVNNQCKLLHGNVCMDTMLVTPELDVRLGFFDMASEHAHLSSSLLARCAPRPSPRSASSNPLAQRTARLDSVVRRPCLRFHHRPLPAIIILPDGQQHSTEQTHL